MPVVYQTRETYKNLFPILRINIFFFSILQLFLHPPTLSGWEETLSLSILQIFSQALSRFSSDSNTSHSLPYWPFSTLDWPVLNLKLNASI